MNSTYISGTLQIDHKRGVIYFHTNGERELHEGICPTPLRICGLGEIKYPLNDRQIDITISPQRPIDLTIQGGLVARIIK